MKCVKDILQFNVGMLCFGCLPDWYKSFDNKTSRLKIQQKSMNLLTSNQNCQDFQNQLNEYKYELRRFTMMITDDILNNIGGISLKVDDLLRIEEAETIS